MTTKRNNHPANCPCWRCSNRVAQSPAGPATRHTELDALARAVGIDPDKRKAAERLRDKLTAVPSLNGYDL